MTKLYGGAIETDLPADAVDVSDFRQVPDTQEVFLLEQPDGLDRLVIIDLLEQVKGELPDILATHLDDILDEPAQFVAPLESMVHPELATDVHTFLVKPQPTKQETESTKLFMFVCIIRLDSVASDALITVNVPCRTDAVTHAAFQQAAGSVLAEPADGALAQTYAAIKHWVSTFQVVDWSLFA